MNINWKIRLKNPVFWTQIATLVLAPMLAAAGMSWDQMVSWGALWALILESVKNPVVVVAMLAGIWGVINDPTTAGLSDSEQALTYTKPNSEG